MPIKKLISNWVRNTKKHTWEDVKAKLPDLIKKFQKEEKIHTIYLTDSQLHDIVFMLTRYFDMVDLIPQRYYVLLNLLRTYMKKGE